MTQCANFNYLYFAYICFLQYIYIYILWNLKKTMLLLNIIIIDDNKKI